MPSHRSVFAFASVFVACSPPEPAPRTTAETPAAMAAHAVAGEPSRDGWNAAQIEWQPFAAGLDRARAEHKPVCLVLHADWCPHCRNYSHVFEDPRIVARARSMVMVRVNVDQSPDVASRFQLDGTYVPRTYFLASDGNVLGSVDAHRPQFHYFYDERDPNSLLAGMDAALQRR